DDSLDSLRSDVEVITHFAPRGWFQREKITYCQLQQQLFEGVFDPERKTVSPERLESNRRQLEAAFRKRYPFDVVALKHQLVSIILLPALPNVPSRTARMETALDEATLACALERYRLAEGKFPPTLDALAPQFIASLPHDVVGGPFRYRTT